jgi:hypothetical protein
MPKTKTTLFDIVNVQNWPAASALARSGSPCCKVATFVGHDQFRSCRRERRRWPFVHFQRPYSSNGESARLVSGRFQVRSRGAGTILIDAPVAQPAGGGSLRKSTVQVRILPGAPAFAASAGKPFADSEGCPSKLEKRVHARLRRAMGRRRADAVYLSTRPLLASHFWMSAATSSLLRSIMTMWLLPRSPASGRSTMSMLPPAALSTPA